MHLMNIFHEEARIELLLKLLTIKMKKVENKEIIIEQFRAYLESLSPGVILQVEDELFDCDSLEDIVLFVCSKVNNNKVAKNSKHTNK
ncbi:hypothetical protein COA01_23130 [Bacillus cereus]|uniref:hypothetical protein n=1 Tax=Bacillus cereus TaxID=1396 RepID=UPI000BFD3D51|nr:hypothetical protein [Bacillus cereus]PGP18638.1 hypothetical protein COA01_23130 [Bacillus cereus]